MTGARTHDYGYDALNLRLAGMEDADLLDLGDLARGPDGAVSGFGGATSGPDGLCGGRAARISALIGRAYDGPPGFDPRRLSLIDRVAALFGIAFCFGRWPARFVSVCEACGAASALTVSTDEFRYAPARQYEMRHGGVQLMQPNGTHEEMLARGQQVGLAQLMIGGVAPPKDADAALAALDKAGPHFVTALPWQCAGCAAEARFWFDPLAWITEHLQGLLHEIHLLARNYGWDEARILAVPRSRRRAYLALIAAGEGRS